MVCQHLIASTVSGLNHWYDMIWKTLNTVFLKCLLFDGVFLQLYYAPLRTAVLMFLTLNSTVCCFLLCAWITRKHSSAMVKGENYSRGKSTDSRCLCKMLQVIAIWLNRPRHFFQFCLPSKWEILIPGYDLIAEYNNLGRPEDKVSKGMHFINR